MKAKKCKQCAVYEGAILDMRVSLIKAMRAAKAKVAKSEHIKGREELIAVFDQSLKAMGATK